MTPKIKDLRHAEIPVVSGQSSKEDLLKYIRILEERLGIDHVVEVPEDYSIGPEDVISGVAKRVDLPQDRRVEMLRYGNDLVGLSMAADAAREELTSFQWSIGSARRQSRRH